MLNIEEIIKEKIKEYIESLLNEIMYEERKVFLKCHDTCGDGYNKRTLRTTFTLDLELRVPKVRKYASDLNYSVFDKYQRTTSEFENLIEKMYTSRLYESDINDLLDMSSISYTRKKKILDKYYNNYFNFIKKKKKASKLLKLDCTYFHSKNSNQKYSVYAIFNCIPNQTELIYFHIEKGNENKAGWEKLIKYLVKNIDLSECKLIVSDMFKALKDLLHETEELKKIKKQNCIWHRIMSLCDCVKINRPKRKELLSELYSKFLRMKKKDCNIFDIFNTFESRSRKIKEYIAVRNSKKAIQINFSDNFSFLDVEKSLKEYQRSELIQSGNVESYFSKLKFYLKKQRNYSSEKVLISKIMMFLEKENEKNLSKKD